jgi:hypothetical protein
MKAYMRSPHTYKIPLSKLAKRDRKEEKDNILFE